jgi:hypothetical protein
MIVYHADHGLTQSHFSFIESAIKEEKGFFIKSIPIPDFLESLQSALYGPSEGDAPMWEGEVSYAQRGARTGCSRMCNKPTREARNVIVIGMWDDAKGDYVIFTAYGSISGSVSPREPYDPTLVNDVVAWEESQNFWAEHALSNSNQ